MRLDTQVSDIYGIGKARAIQLNKLGIYTASDLIYYLPRAYEDRSLVARLGDYRFDTSCSYILTVATEVTTTTVKNRMKLSKFRAFDESGSVEVVFFNAPFVKDVFHVGGVFRFYGKPTFSKANRLNLINPKYEPLVEGTPLNDFIPVYGLTEGLSTKILEKAIRMALNDCLPLLADHLPEELRLKYKLPTLSFALKNIHFPDDREALLLAERRLAFDEMMMFALCISLSKEIRERSTGIALNPCDLKPLTNLLPYDLTGAQKRAINDIYSDTVLKSRDEGVAMSRILVGDVGSGKTICAIAAIYIAAKSGYQSALMVPTEILAQQHFSDVTALLSPLGIRVEILTGSTTAAKKRQIYTALENGEIDVIIGTHALITDKVHFNSLALIITDEQHRFGVTQRGVLKDRAENAHVLVMSATPIPRSLALALYGDLDISRIDEMPAGRSRVDTFVVDESYRSRLNSFIEKQVSLGGQCYIVCPSIESDEEENDLLFLDERSVKYGPDLKNVIEYSKELEQSLPKLRIAYLHGKMKNAEKDEIMSKFSRGEYDVLVSTTVIEVGINVPNATLMIVENAERFGLSQLHQLRGRVGRGKKKSYCVLVSDSKGEKATSRLEIMRTTYDGFEIADQDLLLRGPGDFFSSNEGDNIRQSGGFDFKMASLCTDHDLYEMAFSCAKSIVSEDKNLIDPRHANLKKMIDKIIAPSSTIS